MAIGSSQPWPDSDDRQVVKEMLDDSNSPHWGKCRKFIAECLQKSAAPAEPLDDIIQNSMISVIHGLKNFRFDCKFTSWLRTITRNRKIDWYRDKAREKPPNGYIVSLTEVETDGDKAPAVGPTIEKQYLNDETSREIRDILKEYAGLHEKSERILIILQRVLFQRDRQTEVAKSLGMTSARVNQIVREAERYVREKMGRGPDFDPLAPPKPSP